MSSNSNIPTLLTILLRIMTTKLTSYFKPPPPPLRLLHPEIFLHSLTDADPKSCYMSDLNQISVLYIQFSGRRGIPGDPGELDVELFNLRTNHRHAFSLPDYQGSMNLTVEGSFVYIEYNLMPFIWPKQLYLFEFI